MFYCLVDISSRLKIDYLHRPCVYSVSGAPRLYSNDRQYNLMRLLTIKTHLSGTSSETVPFISCPFSY